MGKVVTLGDLSKRVNPTGIVPYGDLTTAEAVYHPEICDNSDFSALVARFPVGPVSSLGLGMVSELGAGRSTCGADRSTPFGVPISGADLAQ